MKWIKTGEEIIKLKLEVEKLKRVNLRLKSHMNVLVNTPTCMTAAKIRYAESDGMFSDAIINLN
jgi:hypothetical protein